MKRNRQEQEDLQLSGAGGCGHQQAVDQHQLVIGAVQPPLRLDQQSPLEACRHVQAMMREAAASRNINLYVLPELCPVGYSEHTFCNYLPSTPEIRNIYDKIEEELGNLARELEAFICFGTIGWKEKEEESTKTITRLGEEHTSQVVSKNNPSTELEFFIRQVVLNDQGQTVAAYDKMHLCDYGDCAEARFFHTGGSPC